MEHKFKLNDIVKLKSGGPNMTITRYITRNPGSVINVIKRHSGMKGDVHEEDMITVACTWFEGGKQKFNEFEEDALELVSST